MGRLETHAYLLQLAPGGPPWRHRAGTGHARCLYSLSNSMVIYSNFIRTTVCYGRLVKKDHRGQAILKLPCPRHLFAPNGLPPGSFDDFCSRLMIFHKDIGEGAISCFKDTGDQTNLKNVPSPVSLTHQTAPSPTFLISFSKIQHPRSKSQDLNSKLQNERTREERGKEGKRGQSFYTFPTSRSPAPAANTGNINININLNISFHD